MKRLLFFLPYFFMLYACKNGGEMADVSYDPSKPSVVTGFMPDSGYVRTKLVINGDNFGNDKNKLRVEFLDSEGNSNDAVVVNSVNNAIYVIVPRQSGGISNINVYRDENLLEKTVNKEFKYIVTSSVSTVVGKAMDGSTSTDGTLGETTFQIPEHVLVDNDDNLFICDLRQRVRLVSLTQNKSLTLSTGVQCVQSVWVNKEKTKVFSAGQQGVLGCFVFDSYLGWAPEKYGQLLNNGDWMHSVIMDPIDSTFVIYRQNTGQLYTQPFLKGMGISKATQIGTIGPSGNGFLVYNPLDKYVYLSTHANSTIYRFKIKKNEKGIPVIDGDFEEYLNNGAGFSDGGIDEARFNQPRGMAVDSKGFLYVADASNHRIRRIDTKHNVVTTIAGTGEKGYEDGEPLMAKFNTPWGIGIDKNDFIYIADSQNHCIRKLAIE